jgi:phasin family protein
MTFTDLTSLSQGSIDTFVKTNTAAVKGFETLSKYFADCATKSFEEAMSAGKKFSTIKSPVEFIEMQTKYAQESFETIVEESKTVSEMTTSIVKDVTAPWTALFKSTVAAAPKAATSVKKAA